ncbi:MAG: MarR family winged helix-turn-helix transcriptional regulator [Jatrophihabitans sp.]
MASSSAPAPRRRRGVAAEADAVLAACRLLVGVSVQSMAAVADAVSVIQLRILTVIASRESVTLSELAAATGLHISQASRTCDRMVHDGLVGRTEDPDDRRSVRLTLTEPGQRIVGEVAASRRAALEPALRRLDADSRQALVTALEQLVTSAGEPAEADLWALGWAT